MPGGISIHVIDVSRGRAAEGLRVELYRLEPERRRIAGGDVDQRGVVALPSEIGEEAQAAGRYEAVFHVGAFYRGLGEPLPDPPFLDVVTFAFGIADPQQHYHLPLKLTAWGLSLFRGGA